MIRRCFLFLFLVSLINDVVDISLGGAPSIYRPGIMSIGVLRVDRLSHLGY